MVQKLPQLPNRPGYGYSRDAGIGTSWPYTNPCQR